MSTEEAAQRLVLYIRSLADFEVWNEIDGNYDHIGATVADAVLQARMRYESHVRPRIRRILEQWPNERTVGALRALLKQVSARGFLNWGGQDRVERFTIIIDLLHTEGIDSEGDLRSWLMREANLEKLRSIRGIGPKTVDYFKILVGLTDGCH